MGDQTGKAGAAGPRSGGATAQLPPAPRSGAGQPAPTGVQGVWGAGGAVLYTSGGLEEGTHTHGAPAGGQNGWCWVLWGSRGRGLPMVHAGAQGAGKKRGSEALPRQECGVVERALRVRVGLRVRCGSGCPAGGTRRLGERCVDRSTGAQAGRKGCGSREEAVQAEHAAALGGCGIICVHRPPAGGSPAARGVDRGTRVGGWGATAGGAAGPPPRRRATGVRMRLWAGGGGGRRKAAAESNREREVSSIRAQGWGAAW